MNVLFLHGWTSVPGGVKPTHLRDAGHQVFNPALPDEDFEASLEIGNQVLRSNSIDVIVGSSRGGAVAMNLNIEHHPLVLLCPAWKRWGTATRVTTKTIALHSRGDDVIPFADSEQLVENSDPQLIELVEVGSDHRLATPDALAAMLQACERLAQLA